jgi:hypothetical protein
MGRQVAACGFAGGGQDGLGKARHWEWEVTLRLSDGGYEGGRTEAGPGNEEASYALPFRRDPEEAFHRHPHRRHHRFRRR